MGSVSAVPSWGNGGYYSGNGARGLRYLARAAVLGEGRVEGNEGIQPCLAGGGLNERDWDYLYVNRVMGE